MRNRTLRKKPRILFLFTPLCAVITSVQILHAATIIVMNTNDGGAGSLRQALTDVNDGDTINFDPSVTGSITLTSGELFVNDSITISGPGANTLAVNGNAASRVFHINPGKTVTISGLTITNGHAGGIFPDDAGGGIYNDHATLTVSSCAVTGNSADFGGGIYNFGETNGSAALTVSNSTVSGNSVGNWDVGINGAGAGIYNDGEDNGNAALIVSSSTVSGNSANGPYGTGGGIYNDGSSGNATLTASDTTVSGNSASGNYGGTGGGILNDGTLAGNAALTVNTSTVNGNSAGINGTGGGIWNQASPGFSGGPGSATVAISNSTLSSNSATSSGGGIYNFGADLSNAILTISNSTLSSNSADNGGGIYHEAFGGLALGPGTATLTISNSTLSGNSASMSGGGIFNAAINTRDKARVTITNGTLSGNSAASSGGGIYTSTDNAAVVIGQTILKAGSSGQNIVGGIVTSLGYNLSSDDASAFLNASGDQNGTDPLLGPLQNNGGPTFTHALLNGSPALDAGAPPLDYDQRGPGYSRIVNGRIDIGAFEMQAAPAPVPVAPTALGATNKTASSFTAHSSSVSGATGYRLDVSTSSSFVTYVAGYQNLDVGNVTAQGVTSLAAGTFYYYRLRAYNGVGTSPNSNVVSVKTKNR